MTSMPYRADRGATESVSAAADEGLSRWAERRLAAGIVLLAMAPIAVLPEPAQDPFAVKALVAAVGLLLVVTVPTGWAVDRWVGRALLFCALVAGLAALLSSSPYQSFWGRFPRYEGAWVLGLYVLAMVGGGRLAGHVALPARLLTRLVPGLAWAVLVVAALQTRLPGTQRLGGLLGNAVDLGAFGATCSAVLVAAAWTQSNGRVRLWLYSGAAAGLMCVAVSGSRASALAVVVAALVAGALVQPGFRLAATTAGAAVLLVGAGMLLSIPGLGRVAWGAAAESASGRLLLWRDTLRLVASHPVLGVGPSGFVDQVGSAHSLQWAAQIGPNNPPDSPHLLPLQVLAASGLLGLAAVLLLAVALLRPARANLRERRLPSALVVVGLVAYLVGVAVEFTSPTLTPVALAGAGWLAARPASVRRAARAAAILGASAVTVVLSAMLVSEWQVGLALRSLTEDDVAGAQASFDAAHRWAPWSIDLALREGHAYTVLAQNGAPTGALCVDPTATASRTLPASSEAALDRAQCLEANDELETAQEALAPALEHDPNNANLWLESGVLAAEAGNTSAAIQRLTTAARLDPTAYEPWQDLATIYQQTGQVLEAHEASAKALELQHSSNG